MSAQPVYQEVYNKMKKLIRDGEYGVGDFLPPEHELEKIHSVSRTTIRKVIEMLVKDGYIEVKQGRGTKVLDFHYTQNLNCVTSISETLTQKGYVVSNKSIYIDIVQASKKNSERLNVPEGANLFRLQRVQLADNIPTAIMENYIDVNLAPELDRYANDIKTLYGFLETKYGLSVDSANDVISAKSADFVESQMLDVRAGAALLTLRRVTYHAGKPITYDKSIVRADKYQFEITMAGRKYN